jgi:hypothetical protein
LAIAICPKGCATCTTNDIFDQTSVYCQSCQTNYTLENNTQCLLQSVQTCPEGEYLVQIPDVANKFSCSICPSGCATCLLTNSSDYTSLLQCLTCRTGYQLESSKCKPSCSQGQFFNSAANTCQSCDISCSYCTGPSNTQCLRCSIGYKPNSNNTLCVKESMYIKKLLLL